MPTIAKHNEVITVIILFAVEPEQQQELVNNIVEFIEAEVKHQPGFVSSSLHKSLDGKRVLNYAQWKTLEDYKAFLNNSEVQARGAAKISNFHLIDSHVYEVTISLPESADLTIAPGRLIHLGEFRMKPEDQSRLIELERENVTIALEHPDLLSANFHRSLDGTRTMNYGFWQTLDNFELLVKEPKFAPVREYWQDISENEFHLYEVVFTEPSNK